MAPKPVIYAMIPARIGSSRLKMKNLALVNGQPLIYYAVQAAKEAGAFDKIIINSDHEVFAKIADRYDVEFYLRPDKLGSSITKSDDVVADFMHAYPDAEIVAWVNSIAPLQTGEELSKVVIHFLNEGLDSLVTVEDKQVHCLYNGKPVNYVQDAPFALTQDLTPVEAFVYSTMMWRKDAFLDQFSQKGFALLCGKFGTYPVSKLSSTIVKTEDDYQFVNSIIEASHQKSVYPSVQYDSIIKKILIKQ